MNLRSTIQLAAIPLFGMFVIWFVARLTSPNPEGQSCLLIAQSISSGCVSTNGNSTQYPDTILLPNGESQSVNANGTFILSCNLNGKTVILRNSQSNTVLGKITLDFSADQPQLVQINPSSG